MMFTILAVLAVVWFFGLLLLDALEFAPAALMGAIILAIAPMLTWMIHAQNLGTIAAQGEVVSVYRARVESLETMLSGFEYPRSALANSDSPVAAIVKSLSEAQTALLEAEAKRAEAIVSVERTRHGPFSHVIKLAGDYK